MSIRQFNRTAPRSSASEDVADIIAPFLDSTIIGLQNAIRVPKLVPITASKVVNIS